MEFLLQPDVYSTNKDVNLMGMLSNLWISNHTLGDGTIYIISGFANYNGGVRFYPYFTEHIRRGGKIVAILSGNQRQALSSQQVVEALLECGVDTYIVNRKRLVHAKCYGLKDKGEQLIVTSGNFTGPGMSQNAEAALWINQNEIKEMDFSWETLIDSILRQPWDIHKIPKEDLDEKKDPGWKLLYDEIHGGPKLEDDQLVSMVIVLSHADTARIMAEPGTSASAGTQYFWLSKSSFDFFPALTEKNKRGYKNTYSCIINLKYVDLEKTLPTRVTFEADNNLDFRLGTGPLRNTKLADEGDMAILTRIGEYDYELRLINKSDPIFPLISSYAITNIGNFGKRVGYIPNIELTNLKKKGQIKF